MKSIEILSKTDRTCLSRVVMTGRYFMPRLRWILWVYPLIAVLLTGLTYLLMSETTVNMTPMNIISLIIALAPLALGRRADGELTFSLPVNGLEKCVFLFLFFMVFVPVLTFGASALTEWILIHGNYERILPYPVSFLAHSPKFILLALLQHELMVVACLWVMMGARSSRVLLAAIAAIGVSIANSLCIGILGAIIGYRAAINGVEPEDFDIEAATVDSLLDYSTYAPPVMALLLIAALLLAARTICRRQV